LTYYRVVNAPMGIGRFNLTEGPARPVYRFAAGALALAMLVPAIFAFIRFCHTLKSSDLLEFVGWSWGPLWLGWIACTGLMFPDRRRRRGGG
jgi:hypothetical protein